MGFPPIYITVVDRGILFLVGENCIAERNPKQRGAGRHNSISIMERKSARRIVRIFTQRRILSIFLARQGIDIPSILAHFGLYWPNYRFARGSNFHAPILPNDLDNWKLNESEHGRLSVFSHSSARKICTVLNARLHSGGGIWRYFAILKYFGR